MFPVAPAISVKVTPPSVLTCHWYAGVGAPTASAVNVAVLPTVTIRSFGSIVNAGFPTTMRTSLNALA